MKLISDIVYVEREDRLLKLDLYLPSEPDLPCPVVAWVSGGGWRGGGKSLFPDAWFIDSGIAVAAIDYTLSPVRPFPAAIEDFQTAICWLRAHADEYRIMPDRIGVWGGSAGAHLAALLALSAGVRNWEVPETISGQRRTIQAVCAVNGINDLARTADPSQKLHYPSIYGHVSQFLGGPVEDKLDLAKGASPITYVHAGGPPFLIFHGTCDSIVPFEESLLIRDALQKVGVPVEFHAVQGADHGYSLPDIKEMNRKICEFFVRTLRPVSGGAKCTNFYSWEEPSPGPHAPS
jgi:acetyl esterase/lipase